MANTSTSVAKQTGLVVTASGTSQDILLPVPMTALNLCVTATAVSGTSPSLTMAFQVRDANGHYYTAFTATGGQILSAAGGFAANVLSGLAPMSAGRLSWTVSGTTPSFTIDWALEGNRSGTTI